MHFPCLNEACRYIPQCLDINARAKNHVNQRVHRALENAGDRRGPAPFSAREHAWYLSGSSKQERDLRPVSPDRPNIDRNEQRPEHRVRQGWHHGDDR